MLRIPRLSAGVLAVALAAMEPGLAFAQTGVDAGPAPPGAAPGDAEPDSVEARNRSLKELYSLLPVAPDFDRAKATAEAIDRAWAFSGSATTDLLMQRAARAVAEQKLDSALTFLTAAVELQPDYAEAWSRRAYVFYQLKDTERAVGDLRRVLALEPKHFRAIEGLANILRETGSKKAALETYRKLIEVHPFSVGAKQAIEELTREVEGQGI